MVLLTLGSVRYAWSGAGLSLPLPVQAPTALPFAPSWVDGLINAGGQIVPQVDLAKRLQLPTFMPTGLWHDRERGIALPVSDCQPFNPEPNETLATLLSHPPSNNAILGTLELPEGGGQVEYLNPAVLTLPELHLPPLGDRILGSEPQQNHSHSTQITTLHQERSVLVVQVGMQRYALPLNQVQEVLEQPSWFATYHPQPACLGMLPLRQEVLPALSLAVLLGQTDLLPPQAGFVVLWQHQPLALLCDAVLGIEKIHHPLQPRDQHDARWQSWCYTHGQLTAELDLHALLAGSWNVPTLPPAPPSTPPETLSFVVFLLGEETWLLPLSDLIQVAEFQTVTPLPLHHLHQQSDALTQIQGEILPVMDLRRFFALSPCGGNTTAFLLVKPAGESLALTVDKILRVMSVPCRHFERIEQLRQPWLQGFIHTETGLFPVLSPAGLLARGGKQ